MSTSLCRIALVSTDWSEMLRNSRKDSLRPAGPPVLIRTEEAANLAKDLSASRLGGLLGRTNRNGTGLRVGFAESGPVSGFRDEPRVILLGRRNRDAARISN